MVSNYFLFHLKNIFTSIQSLMNYIFNCKLLKCFSHGVRTFSYRCYNWVIKCTIRRHLWHLTEYSLHKLSNVIYTNLLTEFMALDPGLRPPGLSGWYQRQILCKTPLQLLCNVYLKQRQSVGSLGTHTSIVLNGAAP